MSPFTFANIATSAMEKLHLRSKKSSKKGSGLTISSPIEGSFEHHPIRIPPSHIPNALPDYYEDIENADPVMPRRYSDLVLLAKLLSRQVVGTKYDIAHHCGANDMMQRQVERADDVVTNNRVLREEIVELKKQILEQKEIADKLRRSGGKSRNKLKAEVSLLTLEKNYLEGALQETLLVVKDRDARLESVALSMSEALGKARGAEQ